uniref:Uncharacterized protein n=1 Tax=Porphyridium sordidum TaxID=28024 RepID=A0A1C9CDP1_PORSO|nr:hypothetical protein Psor_033 [Porphyridium sordidum]AOM66508.1 hypothetical protein Psor_033 [Porphyridium sordidum]
MNFNIPKILDALSVLKPNQEIIISQNSKAYNELKKAGINDNKISTKDRKQSLLEKYYQEKIIILRKQDSKDKLQNKIRGLSGKKRLQLQVSKEKKKWTKRLERAIINNKVNFFFNNDNKSNHVTGVWNKFLNIPVTTDSNVKQNLTAFPTSKQNKLMEELKDSPIFVVENIFNEIIAGESKNDFYKNFIEKLEGKYYNLFFWQTEDEFKEPYRMGFAFTNPNDALELKEYLEEQFPYSSYEMQLSVKIMSLSELYKLSRTARYMNQIRIIPDINDLGNLLLKFRKKNYIRFHKKQVYGKDFFQGQPLYKLMPVKTNVKAINKNSGNIALTYTPQHDIAFLNDITYYFTNLKDAEEAWSNFYVRYSKVGIPKKPIIEVYNLESLLSDYENNIAETPDKICIVPSKEAKPFIESAYNLEQNKKFSLEDYTILSRSKIGINRFLWGLTHRTAPDKYPAKWW